MIFIACSLLFPKLNIRKLLYEKNFFQCYSIIFIRSLSLSLFLYLSFWFSLSTRKAC